MYTGKQLSFSSFSSDSGKGLTAAIQKFYGNPGKDYTIVHVSYSVAYLGKNDKGKAVRILTGWYKREHQEGIFTIGLGDSLNDLPLLMAVELPILVKQKSGRYENRIKRKLDPFLAKGIGPQGWNQAILEVINKYS